MEKLDHYETLQNIPEVTTVPSIGFLLDGPQTPFKIGVCHDPLKPWHGFTNRLGGIATRPSGDIVLDAPESLRKPLPW